jgi:glycerol-3-phosphate dehydrogenase
MKPYFAIVGCGTTGSAIGQMLVNAGYDIAVSDNNLSTVEKVAEILKADRLSVLPWEITHDADVVFLTCPDRVVRSVCEEIAMHYGFNKYSVVFQCSKELDYCVLSAARRCDAYIGSLYPVQRDESMQCSMSFSTDTDIFLDGDHESMSTGMFLACLLGFRAIRRS